MNRIPFLITFLFITTFSYSQDLNHNRQFGFDASGFLSQFLNFGGSASGNTIYYLTYRKFGEKKNKRYGLGGNLAILGGGGSTSSRLNVNYRYGTERFHDFEKRWRAVYGMDFTQDLSTVSGTDRDFVFSYGFGIAPFLGLQYRINSQLSLSTEVAYHFGAVLAWGDELSGGIATSFRPPLALYAQYDFYRDPERSKK